MSAPEMVFLYLLVGAFSLLSSRRSVQSARGFKSVGETLFFFLLWPISMALRALVFVIEGNLWENLE